VALGFATDFFDTLGIGGFAPTTAIFKLFRRVPDELIPGTPNVGHALPTLTEALIFIAAVTVDPLTLISMIAASVLGAWLGAGLVSRLPRRAVQLGMSTALAAAAVLLLMTNLGWMPGGGEAAGLGGARLAFAVAVNFALGALMGLGIGLYAPCLILVCLLGMSPLAAFPIMMGSCAFLMPIGGVRFIRTASYSPRAALGLTLGGIPRYWWRLCGQVLAGHLAALARVGGGAVRRLLDAGVSAQATVRFEGQGSCSAAAEQFRETTAGKVARRATCRRSA
jgi:hypothetical protein